MDVRIGPKNWCFWTIVLEKNLESPLDCKEIQPVHPKGNLSWVFIGRTDAEVETPILWPPDVKNWLIGKDPDAGKDWRWEGKGTTEYEIVGWHHWLDGHEFEQAPGIGDGQGSLMCCSPWGSKESNTRERLNWTEVNTVPSSCLHEASFSHYTKKLPSYHCETQGLLCLPSPSKNHKRQAGNLFAKIFRKINWRSYIFCICT